MKKTILIFISIMTSLLTYSQKPAVVNSVDLNRYKGKWYEIARLPNWFERKLKCTTAEYVLRGDGRIDVINSGRLLSDRGKKDVAKGLAWVPDKNEPAKLKVRFFWPFTGNYWIMHLDMDYTYVMIGEPSFKYLWILSREKKMDESIYNMLLSEAISNGYDVKDIIRVSQDCE